ncbi:hypothetical protein GCM10011510_18330 [Streptococcus himalayensis]|uniref:Uncharacterized protein n=1 Tax=Streptococcus himalayensis TaxID=1888195 RepID=A0A917ABT2_9STRE|nr:hypothetical protein GCM10011510_18330 [Streptococcus himalayensis]
MTYLLEHLPNEESLAKKEVLETYLPRAEQIQNNCKLKKFQSQARLWNFFNIPRYGAVTIVWM